MKYTLFAAAFCLLFSCIVSAQTDEINIIPKPQSVKRGDGKFRFSRKTKIVATDEAGVKTAGILNDILVRNYGFRLSVTNKIQRKNSIVIESRLSGNRPIAGDLYLLSVSPEYISIAGKEAEMFYAIQTLVQILPVELKSVATIPALDIFDRPRFSYRGMHLDVGRHFMPVEFVKKYIDLMSQYKFNYFHWHLTEDQGWRIEIKKYPKLTEIGSKRPETVKDKNLQPYIGDGVAHEGFYTQEQIKDVVAYAKARYITVVPEIELPGHSSAALAAYPELGCKADYKYKVQTTWGIFKEVYCPTERTFSFLEDVLTEVIGLFPDSPYIHIGGDEVLKDMWKESPEVKELMVREGLKDEHEVQSYFIRRMEKFINSKGKKIIGWDEILEGGLAPNATVMSWRGIKGGVEAAKAKHDVIMTPADYVYFDYGQGDPAYEPINIGNYLTLEKVYGFNPVPKELTSDEAKYIIGGQGNVWTEYMQTPEKVEYMAFPRMLALAESLWSTPENKNYGDFSKRLAAHFPRLDKQNVNYRIPEPTGLKNTVLGANDTAHVDLGSGLEDAKIYYTIDGSNPSVGAKQYDKAFDLDVKQNGRVDVKTIIILPSGRKSSVYTATYLRREYLEPAPAMADKRPGVTFGFSMLSPGEGNPLVASGETKMIGLQQFAKIYDLKLPFSVSFDGYLNVPSDGMYEFQVESSRDAAIYIDGIEVVNSFAMHMRDVLVQQNVLPLKGGLHKIGMRFASNGGPSVFRVRWAIKGQNWRNIGGGELVH